MTAGPGIEPGPHWWAACALTTAPSLLPQDGAVAHVYYLLRAVTVKSYILLDLHNLFQRTFSLFIRYVVSNDDCWENMFYISQALISAVLPGLGGELQLTSHMVSRKTRPGNKSCLFLVICFFLYAHPSPTQNTEHFSATCVLMVIPCMQCRCIWS